MARGTQRSSHDADTNIGEEAVPVGEPLPVEESRILVVDDDAHAAVLMRRLIEREGFSRVETASDGRRALAMMADHRPDIVVLDVHLPELDGFEVLRQIVRTDERTGRPTRVLGVSGDPTGVTARVTLTDPAMGSAA